MIEEFIVSQVSALGPFTVTCPRPEHVDFDYVFATRKEAEDLGRRHIAEHAAIKPPLPKNVHLQVSDKGLTKVMARCSHGDWEVVADDAAKGFAAFKAHASVTH
jgi:hypothetical protein